MANCKDCLHCDVCAHRYEKLCKGTKIEDLNHACTKFKDRTKYVEVAHGHWETHGDIAVCNLCHSHIVAEQGTAELNYCPNCGAKMDGDGNV